MAKNYVGTWKIIDMELWDQEYIDMEAPGFIKFASKGLGEFQFGLVRGGIDWQIEKMLGLERIEFSWEGVDELSPASGRGWGILEEKRLKGRIYFHMGDDSAFTAGREE